MHILHNKEYEFLFHIKNLLVTLFGWGTGTEEERDRKGEIISLFHLISYNTYISLILKLKYKKNINRMNQIYEYKYYNFSFRSLISPSLIYLTFLNC
jgi:hypothetical protein